MAKLLERKFFLLLLILQIVFIILFAFLADYGGGAAARSVESKDLDGKYPSTRNKKNSIRIKNDLI